MSERRALSHDAVPENVSGTDAILQNQAVTAAMINNVSTVQVAHADALENVKVDLQQAVKDEAERTRTKIQKDVAAILQSQHATASMIKNVSATMETHAQGLDEIKAEIKSPDTKEEANATRDDIHLTTSDIHSKTFTTHNTHDTMPDQRPKNSWLIGSLVAFGLLAGGLIAIILLLVREPTEAPTYSPTQAPTVKPLYDPPSQEDCLEIQSKVFEEYQYQNLMKKFFYFDFHVLLFASETNTWNTTSTGNETNLTRSATSDYWLNLLVRGIEEKLVPSLIGCPIHEEELNLRSESHKNRYVIANALVSDYDHQTSYSCGNSAMDSCFEVSVKLDAYLKGDQDEIGLQIFVLEILQELKSIDGTDSLVVPLGLNSTIFETVEFEDFDVVDSPTEMPTIAGGNGSRSLGVSCLLALLLALKHAL